MSNDNADRAKKTIDVLMKVMEAMSENSKLQQENFTKEIKFLKVQSHLQITFLENWLKQHHGESQESIQKAFDDWFDELSDEEFDRLDDEAVLDSEEDETYSDEIQIKNVAEPQETQKLWSMDEILNELNTPKKDD
tara:strand:- start:776 stop:1183 length:408 start_codon:yes stop_codon:yes gene_type:complete